MATVIVASSKANAAKRIQFEGSTFGELKANQEFASLYESGLDAVVNPGNVTLRGDDSVLPQGDFKVFLIPSKNKAGYFDLDDTLDEIKEELEEVLEYQVSQIKEAILAKVREFKNNPENQPWNAPGEVDQELQEAIQQAKNI